MGLAPIVRFFDPGVYQLRGGVLSIFLCRAALRLGHACCPVSFRFFITSSMPTAGVSFVDVRSLSSNLS